MQEPGAVRCHLQPPLCLPAANYYGNRVDQAKGRPAASALRIPSFLDLTRWRW
jgi:hypothetical protein